MTKKSEDNEAKMRKFLQLHILTSYPPANLNRDDLGRPKTAVFGGQPRLRISSQSLKRAWRTSSVFEEKLGGIDFESDQGIRTKRFGREVYRRLIDGNVKEKDATAWARDIADQFGKIKSDKKDYPENLDIEQIAFISPAERTAVFDLIEKLIKENKSPTPDDLKLLRHENSAADIAMFGRMLADATAYKVEAAVQVGHAISVQKIAIEDDYFTAVDDLNKGEDDAGAGHLGEREFASGLFYLYINIDRELLFKNLAGASEKQREIYENSMKALVEAAATVAPTGMQNSFGSRARASYIMAELGNQQPRNLSLAYIEPVTPVGKDGIDKKAIHAIQELRDQMDAAYDKCSDEVVEMDVRAKKGTLADIIQFSVKD